MLVKRKKNLIWKKVNSQVVILDVEKSLVYELNDSASFVLSLINKYTSVDEIIKKIESQYSINTLSAKKDILSFIKKNKHLFDFKD